MSAGLPFHRSRSRLRLSSYRELPLRLQLIVLITLTASVALISVLASFLVYDRLTYRRAMTEELRALAQVIGPNFAVALAFDYRGDAAQVLAALAARPSIRVACVYTREGEIFARHVAAGSHETCPPAPLPVAVRLGADRLELSELLRDAEGQPIGTFYLSSDLAALRARVLADVGILGAVAAGAFLLSLLLASRVEKLVSAPILELARAARAVSQAEDYALRVPARSRGEVGTLVEAFNGMLAAIQARDGELRVSHERLEEYSRTLEGRVEERTAQLAAAKAEAEEARDRALSASRAKGSFLANMSHELKTPLNAVICYAQLLGREATRTGVPGFVRDLDRIERAGKHLLGLVDDVLDLSRIEAGRMDLVCERFSLAEVVGTVVNTVEPLLALNGNRLEVSCADLGMDGDRTKVAQILFNLLSNACKFTERGQIGLTAAAAARAAGPGVEIRVSDSGPGIDPAHQGLLFEPFSQVDPSLRRRQRGSGLGLAISRHYCRMMNGDISLDSAPGRGSTFTVWLPLAAGAGEPRPAPAPEA